ncbi:alpha/beta hydrolase [Cryobacterium sp. TMT1-2-2]|uniref:alpha/beta fold hydrolase n=1 Tax=Cryobacterium sp. TMT1-2-2 TaxID=1259233 RepID=UPI00106BAB00|nr:alpha/beta hydrolase family protein [Cryobacterium sp. TMT1-2-2]TFD12247.1 alpha/beta hydrolase [Cryobacterium sp. TMT1-2-2]
MTTQIVLVPGFWLGAWAWDDVAPLLVDRGYAVAALTLPGLEPDDSGRGGVTLDDHAEAIAAALDRGADRRVLVVHSGAALPGTVVLDRHPGLVDHVAFVDAAPVRDGFAMNAELQDQEFPLSAAWDSEMAEGSMRDLTDEQLSTFRERAVPQPGHTVSDPVVLSDPARLAVPGTVICTAFPSAEYRSYAEQGMGFLAGLLDHTALVLVDLPTGHWPMWSRPVDLAELIDHAAVH